MKKLSFLLAALLLATFTTGCDRQETMAGTASETTSEITAETTMETSPETTAAPKQQTQFTEVTHSIPEGMTMDDLRNMFIVNGKTLSLPLTLNSLTDIDERLSYEIWAPELFNNDVKLMYLYSSSISYDIFWDGQPVSRALMGNFDDLDDFNDLPSQPILLVKGFSREMAEAGINISLTCGIDLDSSVEDVEAVFGKGERIYSYIKYTFTDGDDVCEIKFGLEDEDGETDGSHLDYISVNFNVPREGADLGLELPYETMSYEITDFKLKDFTKIKSCGYKFKVPCELEDVDSELLENSYRGASFDEIKEHFDGEFPGDLSLYATEDGEYERAGTLQGNYGVFRGYAFHKFDIKGLNENSTKEDVQKVLGRGNIEDSAYRDCYGDENYRLTFVHDYDYEYDGKGSHYLVPTKCVIIFRVLTDEEKAEAAEGRRVYYMAM